jgi:hypothetical protein
MFTRHPIVLASFFVIVGLTAGAAVGWYATSYHLGREFLGIHHYRAAVEGKLQTKMLRQIRDGKYEDSITILEMLLDANLVSLAQLDESSLPTGKVEVTYAAIEQIRQYREKFPRDAISQSAREAIAKALSLKQSGQARNP